jgi:hypothetical protein
VRDDRPYFYQYYRFSRLFEALRSGEVLSSTQQHGYWPFVILAAVFVQGIVLVAVFIFGPLALWRRGGLAARGAAPFSVYFAALGMGYIMLELALMQKFALVVGDPIYSIMIVLSSMLVFTGLGSFLSGRVGTDVRRALATALAAVLLQAALMVVGLDTLVRSVLGTPFAVRVLVVTLVSGGLCIALGFFFPIGVRVVDCVAPGFLPWAWGINGGFSVLGSVATVALAMATGFRVVIAAAALVYVIGVLTLVWFCRTPLPPPSAGQA